MKYGARNQFMGEVTNIKEGTVMCEVKLKVVSCDTMESVMTMESLKDMGIKKGDKVRIVVKAINVLLVKEQYWIFDRFSLGVFGEVKLIHLSQFLQNNRGRDGPLSEGAGAVDLSINAAILFEIEIPVFRDPQHIDFFDLKASMY